VAKAACWTSADAEARKPGERTGLDTPVVLAVNDGYEVGGVHAFPAAANVVSTPPGEYGRKETTERGGRTGHRK